MANEAGTGTQDPNAGAGAGAAGAAGAGSGTGTGTNPDNKGTGAGAGTGGAQKYEYTEDRSTWVDPSKLRHRFEEVGSAAEKRAREALQGEIDARDAKIRALAGVAPVDPSEKEKAEIRNQFQQIYPWAAKLTDEKIDKILALADKSDQLEQTTNHYWEQKGTETINALAKKIETELGGELSDDQYDDLAHAYVRYVKAGGPARVQQHERDSSKLVEEFSKQYIDRWFAPARRKVTAQAVDRTGRRIPNSRGGQVVTTQKAKIDFNDEDAFKNALREGFRDSQAASS